MEAVIVVACSVIGIIVLLAAAKLFSIADDLKAIRRRLEKCGATKGTP